MRLKPVICVSFHLSVSVLSTGLKFRSMNHLIIWIILSAFVTVSCQHDPILPLFPGDVSYAKDIVPIMQKSCAYSGCHSSGNNINFPLEKYSDLLNYGQVVPYKPLESDLYDVIVRRYMPLGNTLPLADQKLVYEWILKGAQDN